MEDLVKQLFSKRWSTLLDDHDKSLALYDDPTIIHPGVYIIAYSEKALQNQEIELGDVFYVGMSNSTKGVKGRLKQFVNGIQGEGMHSGGQHFKREYAEMQPFHSFSRANNGKRFFYAFLSIRCQVIKKHRTSNDLRKMGEVACLEYYALAHIKDSLGTEPELNKK